MDLLNDIRSAMQAGNAPKVRELAAQGLNEGLQASDILDTMIGGMNEIGIRFNNNEIFIPEVLVAARAMQAGLDILRPMLEKSGVKPVGKVVIGTVSGDIHDIGKNLVRMMLVGAGFDVTDLGVDVKPEKFVTAVREHHPDLVAISALLTTTMLNMQAVVSALVQAGLRESVKIMVGGSPVTEAYAKEIGADGYSSDAAEAVETAKRLIGK